MWTTPEKHTKKRKTLGNTNQNKNHKKSWVQGRSIKKKEKRKHSELKEPHETLDKIKTLTTIARQKKAKEKALK